MKAGRNDPCPCGSGKKFKNCCLRKDQQTTAGQQVAFVPPPSEPAKRHRFPSELPRPRPPAPLAPPRVSRPEPPARPLTPAEAREKARWEEFTSQVGEDQVAVFLKTLGDKKMMPGETAI